MTIKELRLKSGLSQQKFADKFHIQVDNLRNWEQGRNKPLDCIPYMIEYILELEGVKNEAIHSSNVNGESST